MLITFKILEKVSRIMLATAASLQAIEYIKEQRLKQVIYKQINACATCKKNKKFNRFTSAAWWICSVFSILFRHLCHIVTLKKCLLWLCVHKLVSLPFLHCLVFHDPTFSGAKKRYDPPASTFSQVFFKYSVPAGRLLLTSPSQGTGLWLG